LIDSAVVSEINQMWQTAEINPKKQQKQKQQPDNILGNKFCNLALGHDSVVHVKSSIFPLDGAVDIQCITQPVIRWPPTKWPTEHASLSNSYQYLYIALTI